MCSVFGFIARKSSPGPELSVLGSIIRADIARGPHAFGFAWVDSRDRLRMFKSPGRMTDSLAVLELVRDARMLVGHLRYATHGAPESNINNHPHPADGGWIVHNGVVRNHENIVRALGVPTVTECDSESIGLLIEDGDGPLLTRVVDAVDATTGNLVVLGLWKAANGPGQMVVARRDNPLHLCNLSSGLYFGSLASGLPEGSVKAVRNNTARVFRYDADGNRKDKVAELAVRNAPAVARGSLFDSGEYAGG